MVTQNMLRTNRGLKVFLERIIRVVTALELIKCLKQVKQQRLLICAPTSELPPNKRTMIYIWEMMLRRGCLIYNGYRFVHAQCSSISQQIKPIMLMNLPSLPLPFKNV